MHEIWEALVEGAPFSFINLGVLAFGVGVIIDRAWYIRMNYSVDAAEFELQKVGMAEAITGSESPVVSEELVKQRYGKHFNVILGDLKQTDDLRVLDYDGHHVFYNFSIDELGEPIYHEG